MRSGRRTVLSRRDNAEVLSIDRYLNADGVYSEQIGSGTARISSKSVGGYGIVARLELDVRKNVMISPEFGHMRYIVYFDRVKGVLESGVRQKKLRPGILYSGSGTEDAPIFIFSGGSPVSCFIMIIDTERYSEVIARRFPDLAPYLDGLFDRLHGTRAAAELEAVLDQMMRYVRVGTASDLFYESKFNEVMSWLISSAEHRSAGTVSHVNEEDRRSILVAAEYISGHIQDELSLGAASKRALMSPSKFGRCFKSVMGCSFSEYRERIRLDHAKEMLEHTDDTVTSIARSVGYMKLSNFNAFFFKYMHMSPKEYRKSHASQGTQQADY